jgi:hypothetical protein
MLKNPHFSLHFQSTKDIRLGKSCSMNMKRFKFTLSSKNSSKATLPQKILYQKAIPRDVQLSIKRALRILSPPQRRSFLELSPEIRNIIYTYCLYGDQGNIGVCRSANAFPKAVGDSAPHTHFSVGFLRVCRQISQEATSVFYGLNKFTIGPFSTREDGIFPLLDEDPGRDLEDATAFFDRLGHNNLASLRHVHGFSQVSGGGWGKGLAKILVSKILPGRNVVTLQIDLMSYSDSVEWIENCFKELMPLIKCFVDLHPHLKKVKMTNRRSMDAFDLIFVAQECDIGPKVSSHSWPYLLNRTDKEQKTWLDLEHEVI